MMKFTHDWFSHNIPNFQVVKQLIPECKSILEIGCYEGRATCWMLENLLANDGSISCVDTFQGSEEHQNMDFTDVFQRWKENIEWVRKEGQSCFGCVGKSYDVLAKLITENQEFDFIYVDGSHTAPDVMTDACLAWGMLKKGGIMLFDDYLWGDVPGMLHRPKIAVDYFATLFSEESQLVLLGYQLALKKI
jgi:predicted O-methyltransferase YrrM